MFSRKQLRPLLCMLTVCSVASPLLAQPLDDPMRPPGDVPAISGSKQIKKGSAYQLSAIRITKQGRSATINGKSVIVGERVGAAKVTAIEASSVTLSQAGKTLNVSLLPISIKKPVEATQP